jgi:shikimate dehydrogenase
MTTYGLIGKSLGHSFSKKYFTEKFKKEGRSAQYENFELSTIKSFPQLICERPEIEGLNVTIPYKESIIPFLDEIDDEAQQIGAVNTIKIKNGKCIGYNTDAYGFKQSIKPFLRNVHEKALILGTGGASKAVAYTLENIGIEVAYLTRNPEGDHQFSYAACNEIMMNAFKLIVNCTPLGTHPNINEMPNIPISFVSKDHLVIDLIYNPPETKLLTMAKATGADILNGETMLREQAEKSLTIWESDSL